MRQRFEAGIGQYAACLAYEYRSGWRVPLHSHRSDQLIYAISGVMHVTAGNQLTVLPPLFALWVPAEAPHGIYMPEAVSMRTLYLRPGLVKRRVCEVIAVSPLFRELILETVRLSALSMRRTSDQAFWTVLSNQIEQALPIPTSIALPAEPRARKLAEQTVLRPGDSGMLAEKCRKAGLGVRTLQRIFRREVGVDFETWRRQVRITKAVELLAAGTHIKEVAHAVGYQQPSSFVAMFRSTLGMTPSAWAHRFGVSR